ncbi:Amidohydrolase 3 domain-containing protein [Sphingomonas antarctica]|uniref:amidohydrolase n=1 Tax=Sphingomonas antarctica TaxID=2040274 RepID=UPI0039E92D3F
MKWLPLALVAFASAPPAFADGLVDNVNGVTLDENGRVVRFSALTVTADGHIGKLIEAGNKKPDKLDWRYDGKGQVLMPGLIDAHTHVMETGLAALSLDLSGTTSLAQAQDRIRAFAAAHPERKWILGGGWNQERWALGRFPTAAELDLADGRPIWLSRADGHAGWANAAALKAAGITAATKAPPGGRIEGGVFVDSAKGLVERVVPSLTSKDRDLGLAKAQDVFLAYGVTAVADMGTSGEDWLAFRRAGDEGRLRVRIVSYSLGLEPMEAITSGQPTPWLYGDRLRMSGVKLYADGALGSRGACLKQPYADKPTESGACFMDDAKLRNLMVRASMDGMQVAVHAIGDRANAQVLSAIEEVSGTFNGDRRWRIEHAQIVDPADLPRFGKHGIVASMQPVHQTSDRTMAEARLGPARLAGAYAWASMLRNGASLVFGSDTPVERPDPWAGMAAAVTREDDKGEPFGGWQAQERVTREQALAGYTIGAARAMFAEAKLGRLAPGMDADFVLVDVDPLQSTPSQLRATRVSETWIGGVRAWKR